jgi:hypothetical protein
MKSLGRFALFWFLVFTALACLALRCLALPDGDSLGDKGHGLAASLCVTVFRMLTEG